MITLNTWTIARDQVASSKCLKHMEKMLSKPPIPGIEAAVGQLLFDWNYLFGYVKDRVWTQNYDPYEPCQAG